jgi:hypothetical protein
VSKATVSRFFKEKFGERGYQDYVTACVRDTIGSKLAVLQGGSRKLFAELRACEK